MLNNPKSPCLSFYERGSSPLIICFWHHYSLTDSFTAHLHLENWDKSHKRGSICVPVVERQIICCLAEWETSWNFKDSIIKDVAAIKELSENPPWNCTRLILDLSWYFVPYFSALHSEMWESSLTALISSLLICTLGFDSSLAPGSIAGLIADTFINRWWFLGCFVQVL